MSNIVVPPLGESVVEARIARWLKKEGEPVQTGEPLVELETEKVDLEVGADQNGVLASIKRKEGGDVLWQPGATRGSSRSRLRRAQRGFLGRCNLA